MMPAGAFLFLLLLTAVHKSSETVCSYQDVLNYLNLTRNNELFFMTRPVKDYQNPTQVFLEVLLYAILDVREIDQTFVPYVWIFTKWQNEHIHWDPNDFCGIEAVSLPTEVLWKPDIAIEEMTEKDKAPPSPHLTITSTGEVHVQDDQVLVSTCRMHVYKFPFDIQSCKLTFKSVVHSDAEIQLVRHINSSQATEWSREVMRTQYEWLFINMTVTNKTVNMFDFQQDVMIYTISMKRRSLLYIVNFLLPILFFFCLDLASFLISDSGGEKLSFKVTVLLAVTVMQLILNEILPSSSDRIPLIVVYCIGIFALMMLSLLETILVMYLMEKDSSYQDNKCSEAGSICQNAISEPTGYSLRTSLLSYLLIEISRNDRHTEEEVLAGYAISAQNTGPSPQRLYRCQTITKDNKWTPSDVSVDETPIKLLKGSSSQMTEESHASDELREVVKMLAVLLNSRKEEGKPSYWTRVAKTINKVFFIFYVIAASLFLVYMFFHWTDAHDNGVTRGHI